MPNVDVPVDAKLEQAAALLEERFDPRAIVLFGSRAQGRQRADSDHDLAMLVGRPVPDVFAVATARSDLEDLLGGDVDLVVLDEASPILAMEILRGHVVLRRRDPDAFENFVVRTLGAYFDLKRVREPIESALVGTGSR